MKPIWIDHHWPETGFDTLNPGGADERRSRASQNWLRLPCDQSVQWAWWIWGGELRLPLQEFPRSQVLVPLPFLVCNFFFLTRIQHVLQCSSHCSSQLPTLGQHIICWLYSISQHIPMTSPSWLAYISKQHILRLNNPHLTTVKDGFDMFWYVLMNYNFFFPQKYWSLLQIIHR